MESNMSDVCTTCLCRGRNLHFIGETGFSHVYTLILSEIQVYDLSRICVRVCWECKAMLNRFEKFKNQVKSSYMMLMQYAGSVDTPRLSRLQMHSLETTTYPINQIKTEYEIPIQNGLDSYLDIKNEVQEVEHCEPETFVNDLSFVLPEREKVEKKTSRIDDKYEVSNNESLNSESDISTTAAGSSSSTSQSRLRLLDGTYFKYLPDESTGSNLTAMCMKCPKDQITRVKGYNNCTSNFLNHLKRKHGKDCVDEYRVYLKRMRRDGKKLDDNATCVTKTMRKMDANEKVLNQKQFDENILRYFIHSMIPLRGVEDPYFRAIFSDLGILEMGLSLMSRRILEGRIENCYEKRVTRIKSELNEIEYVCTAIDIWSSDRRCFLGVTAHGITSDLRRIMVALACRRFQGIYTYDRICGIVQEINADFDLNVNKIVASVINDGGDFVKAFKVFGVKLRNIDYVDETSELEPYPYEDTPESNAEEEETRFDSNTDTTKSPNCEDVTLLPIDLRCSSHTLTLCATTDANKILTDGNTSISVMHAAVMKKCNILWEAAGRPESAKIIQEVLEFNLSRPCETRWNSLFDALQQILNIKDNNFLLHRSLNIGNYIEKNEFVYLEEYLTCAAPVAEALDIMQNETNAYYGIVLPCLLALRRRLQKIEKNNNFSYCKPLIEAYTQSVERRFGKIYNINTPDAEKAAIAALSYPRFKNKWLTCLEAVDSTKVVKAFNTCISKEMDGNDTPTISTKTKNREDVFFNFDSDSETDMFGNERSRLPDALSRKAELLMLHFFSEESEELDLLNRYPEIKSVFIKYNTPLPSSAAVERIFSFATVARLPRNNLSSGSLFEKRVVLRSNLDTIK